MDKLIEDISNRMDERNRLFWEDFFKRHFNKDFQDESLKFLQKNTVSK